MIAFALAGLTLTLDAKAWLATLACREDQTAFDAVAAARARELPQYEGS
jgi:hypothetical protein